MKTNQKGIKILHEFETCAEKLPDGRLKAYLCPAAKKAIKEGRPPFYTIGWGNTTYENGQPVQKDDIITQERADELFENILTEFEEMAEKAIVSQVNENQFSAFVSALYNIGHGNNSKDGLIRLKNGNPSTLLRKINTDPGDETIAAEFMKWISKGTNYENGLKKRRAVESNLYFQ